MTDQVRQSLSTPVSYFVRVQDGVYVPKGTTHSLSAPCKVSFPFLVHIPLTGCHYLGNAWGGYLLVLGLELVHST